MFSGNRYILEIISQALLIMNARESRFASPAVDDFS